MGRRHSKQVSVTKADNVIDVSDLDPALPRSGRGLCTALVRPGFEPLCDLPAALRLLCSSCHL